MNHFDCIDLVAFFSCTTFRTNHIYSLTEFYGLKWLKIYMLNIQVLHLNIYKNTQPIQVLDSQRQMETHTHTHTHTNTHTHTHTKQNSQPAQLSLKMFSAVAAACISDSLFPKSFGLLPLPLFLPYYLPCTTSLSPTPLYNLSTFTLTFSPPHPASQPSPSSPLSK